MENQDKNEPEDLEESSNSSHNINEMFKGAFFGAMISFLIGFFIEKIMIIITSPSLFWLLISLIILITILFLINLYFDDVQSFLYDTFKWSHSTLRKYLIPLIIGLFVINCYFIVKTDIENEKNNRTEQVKLAQMLVERQNSIDSTLKRIDLTFNEQIIGMKKMEVTK